MVSDPSEETGGSLPPGAERRGEKGGKEASPHGVVLGWWWCGEVPCWVRFIDGDGVMGIRPAPVPRGRG